MNELILEVKKKRESRVTMRWSPITRSRPSLFNEIEGFINHQILIVVLSLVWSLNQTNKWVRSTRSWWQRIIIRFKICKFIVYYIQTKVKTLAENWSPFIKTLFSIQPSKQKDSEYFFKRILQVSQRKILYGSNGYPINYTPRCTLFILTSF